MRPSIRGNVRLAALRQQSSVYLDAQIDAFAAPLRWYYTDFPDYLQEGVGTAKTIPVLTGSSWTDNREITTQLGIGMINDDFAKFYAQNLINIHNEWFRWPEDAKSSVTTPSIAFFEAQGPKVVNLPTAATRMHDLPSFTAGETDVASVTVLDVRTLALIEARFGQAAKTDWTSQDRYQVYMKDIYGAKGNVEVDTVPTRLRNGAKLSVLPRDVYATDGPSMGELMSLSNFQVNHTWDDYVAPEHMVIAYIMVLRVSPVMEHGVGRMIYPSHTTYADWNGDPNVIGAQKPQAVVSRQVDVRGDGTTIGYLPAGWEWREGFNHVDFAIGRMNNFPLLDFTAQTATAYRDASAINEGTFRSVALRHWFADLDMTINVDTRIPIAGSSIMSGARGGGSIPKGNHPTGGFVS